MATSVKSERPNAEAFQKKLFGSILPQIQRFGYYDERQSAPEIAAESRADALPGADAAVGAESRADALPSADAAVGVESREDESPGADAAEAEARRQV